MSSPSRGVVGEAEFERLSVATLATLPALSTEERRVGMALYRALLRGRPASIEGVAGELETSPGRVIELLEGQGLRSLVLHPDGDEPVVVGFAGLAVIPMRHQFVVGDHTLHTWCAWDGLFLPGILGVPAQLVSRCPDTGATIRLRVDPGGIEGLSHPGAVVSFPTSGRCCANAAETRASFCDHVFFLASRGAGDRWLAGRAGAVLLSMDQAFELGRRRNAALFPDRMTAS